MEAKNQGGSHLQKVWKKLRLDHETFEIETRLNFCSASALPCSVGNFTAWKSCFCQGLE